MDRDAGREGRADVSNPGHELDLYFSGLAKKAQALLAAELRNQANRLSEAQRDAAPQGETGNLRASCRVEDGRNELEVVVLAGGPLTTKEVRIGSGEPYDYALAVEFGNARVGAQPFFFPIYRRMRRGIEGAINKAMEQALK